MDGKYRCAFSIYFDLALKFIYFICMESKESLKNKESSRDKRLKNLKPFKKGQSGNPNGRKPKELCIPDILRAIGDEIITDPASGKPITKIQYLMYQVYARAGKGEPWAVQFIADRTEGKAVERIMKQKVYDEIVINPVKDE
jgi:hypothetical protein